MGWIARRRKLDMVSAAFALVLGGYALYALACGEIFIPSKTGPGEMYRLASDRSGFWWSVGCVAALGVSFGVSAFWWSPSLVAKRRAQRRGWEERMRRERSDPNARSALWMLVIYLLLPAAIVTVLFFVGPYIG